MSCENLSATYTKEIELSLTPYDQQDISNELYATFANMIGDVKDIDPDEIPGNVLRDFFKTIVLDMIDDEEFWED